MGVDKNERLKNWKVQFIIPCLAGTNILTVVKIVFLPGKYQIRKENPVTHLSFDECIGISFVVVVVVLL